MSKRAKELRELFERQQARVKEAKKDNKKLGGMLSKDQKFILDHIIEHTKCTDYISALVWLMKKARIKDSKKGTGKKKSDNIKLGDMGTHMELPGDVVWYIPELDLYVVGTCTGFCTGCFDHDCPGKSACYVLKALVRWTCKNPDKTTGDPVTGKNLVKRGQAYRTLAMIFFKDFYFEELDTQLTNKRKKFPVIRINESGELTCYDDMRFWCELARRHPETKFYLYTKNYKAAIQAVKMDEIPDNLFINISIWHEYGIDVYKNLADHPQIRAFVLVDSEVTKRKAKAEGKTIDVFWDENQYAKNGIEIDGHMCPAYNEKGEMDHNHKTTCDKCGNAHCFSRINKITGCYDHS